MLAGIGQPVDMQLDVTKPGLSMAHCHIAEPEESEMLFSLNVDE
jgi:hypothetical protein